MNNYTKIPNEILTFSQLSISARYLYCVLLKYCGKDEYCFPSQKTLAKDLGLTDRQIRNLIKELAFTGIVFPTRRGWNRSNTYKISKLLRNGNSYMIGSQIPLNQGNKIPPKSTYIKGKGKRSYRGLEKLRDALIRKGIR